MKTQEKKRKKFRVVKGEGKGDNLGKGERKNIEFVHSFVHQG